MVTTNLLEVIKIVKENEHVAAESYQRAAEAISNKMGKLLFEQLSEFERYHLQQITALEKTYIESDSFIDYEGREFPLPPLFEVPATVEADKKSVMQIIAGAIELEKTAEKTYSELAQRISDPRGHEMFRRLSNEEHKHFIILEEAYWALTNLGTWRWSTE